MYSRLNKFTLITYQNLDNDERNVFTLLYQPLLGQDAYTLYLTLWSLIERSRLKSPVYFHDFLYDLIKLTPKDFEEARKKLEALGLVVVYKKNDEYLYEIKVPLTAEEFIKDGSLGVYLYKIVGESHFEKLINLFKISEIEKDGFENITNNFCDVFEAVEEMINVEDQLLNKSKSKLTLETDFDFELFFDGLSKNYVDKRKITQKVKDAIKRVAYIYSFDEIDMQKVFMDAITKDRTVDLDVLSKSANKWYNFERESNKETRKLKHNQEDTTPKKSTMNETDYLNYFKTISPIKLLENESGQKAASSEIKVIEQLYEKTSLKEEVINVLIAYVLGIKENVFPSFNYFEKIASEWSRNDLTTAEAALEYIKNRNKQMNQPRTYQKNTKTLPEDIKSDWLDDYIKNL